MVIWSAPSEEGEMSIPQRIALIGTSGAGETTLGREIAQRLNTVFIEIDALQHQAHWTQATVEELRAGIEAQIGGRDRWVIDDTCRRELGDFVSRRLDVILPPWGRHGKPRHDLRSALVRANRVTTSFTSVRNEADRVGPM
jgi:hypothetical protein